MDPYRSQAAPSRPCPRCEIGLGSRTVLDATFDECSDCTGVFVPAELVPRLLDPLDLGLEVVSTFSPGVPAPEPAVRYLKCPRCGGMMNRRLMIKGSNVIVDRCTKHGVWFDAHELRRLAEFAAQHDLALRDDKEPDWIQSHDHHQRDEASRKVAAAALIQPIGPHDRGTAIATLFEWLSGRRRG